MPALVSIRWSRKLVHDHVRLSVQQKCHIVSDVMPVGCRRPPHRRVSTSMYRLTCLCGGPLAIFGHALELGLLHRVPPLQKRRPPRWWRMEVCIVDDGAVTWHCQWIRGLPESCLETWHHRRKACCRFAATLDWGAPPRRRPSNDSRPSSPCSTTTAAPHSCGVAGQAGRVCRWNCTVLSLATLLLCLKHRKAQIRRQGSECRIRTLGGNLEPPGGQELFQYGLHRGCSSRSLISRSWKVPAARSTRFGLG